jgi:hypothetical protein
MRTRCGAGAVIIGVCMLLAAGCGASRERLTVVRITAHTPPELAALLRRPVRMPKSCRLTKPVRLKTWGYTLGRQPLRAIVDSFHDGARQSFRGRTFHGWWYSKVVWIEPVAYRGWVLVRGIGVDQSRMGFLLGGRQRPETALTLHYSPPPNGQSNLAWGTAALIPHGGCYAYQIDGRAFSYSIIVRAYR